MGSLTPDSVTVSEDFPEAVAFDLSHNLRSAKRVKKLGVEDPKIIWFLTIIFCCKNNHNNTSLILYSGISYSCLKMFK